MPDTDLTAAWTTASLVVVDVEGNGQQPPGLVELALVPIVDGAVGAARTWLVKPALPITGFVTRLHGITNADVADAASVEAVADAITAELAGAIVVAHNAHIDVDVLRRHLPGWQPGLVVDTLKLARRFYPGRASYRLGALIAEFGLADQMPAGLRPHRAEYDAIACAYLFLRLATRPDQPPLSVAELCGEATTMGGDDDEHADRLF